MTQDQKVEIPIQEKTLVTPRKLSPVAIYNEISKTVIGQEEAKKTLSLSLFLHFVRFYKSLVKGETEIKKSNLLLMGPSGSGKTFMVREGTKALERLTGRPIGRMLEVDCTELTARGWEGDDLSGKLAEHYRDVGSNEAIFTSSVVFLDEFDKLCKPAVGKSGVDHNRNTQYNMLKLIEGSTISSGARKVSTHKMLFVMAGNFSEVRKVREDSQKLGMGFTDNMKEPEKYIDYHTELEKIGMATQLVGRTPHIAELYDLDKDELNNILDVQTIPDIKDVFEFLGKDLELQDSDRDIIISNCIEKKLGARGLYAELNKLLHDRLFNLSITL